MKRFILISLIIFLSFDLALAQTIKEINTTIDIQSNGKTNIEIIFRFTDEIKEVQFPIPYEIYDLTFDGGKCYVEKSVKNVLICKPSSPFIVGQIIIKTNFRTEGMTTTKNNKTSFTFDIPILIDTERMNVVVKLPELMALVDNDLLPLSPSGANIGSDGRRIVLKWHFEDEFKGDIIPLRIYYENLNPTNFLQLIDFRWIIFFLLIIAVGVFLVYDRVSKKSSIVLSILNEAERTIVNIIQQTGGKDIDQRLLVKSSGFSKAKVTRVLQSLEARGVVSLTRIGRKNKVVLKKKFVEEKTEQ
jgi:hypothetical protein